MTRCCLLPFVLAFIGAGCVGDLRYRYAPDQECRPQPSCINLPARESEPGKGWELAYAEFRDDGGAWDALQTKSIISLIEQAKADNGGAAVVVLYVHGWKNNANAATPPARKDVEKFKTALDRIATMASRVRTDGKLPPLVGIYIAWRGLTATVEPLKTLSVWPRRAVARRVGRHDSFDTMDAIVRAAKPSSADRTRLILFGHSFGARVLENAVDGIDAQNARAGAMRAWQQAVAASAGALAPSPPVDLIGFINAATQSTITGEAIRRLQASNTVFYGPGGSVEACKDDPRGDRRPECRPIPLSFAVSSTGDLATRYLLPVANALIPAGPFPWRLRAAAFTGGLQSHEIDEVNCPPPVPHRCSPLGDRELCFEANRNDQRVCYEMRRKANASNQTPFWVMTVDPRVVTDHGDIWNQNLLDLFAAVIERSQAANVDASRAMTRQ
jgi:hypothetical protein